MVNAVTTPELTEEQAIKISREILHLEATLKEMKEQLKKYVQENGELIADDTIWKFQNAESWDFADSNRTKEFLKSLVIDGFTADPYSVVTINKSKIKKLGVDDTYLEKFAIKKVSKRFVNRKK
jgi:effector-binding domain-containing protein